MQLSCFCNLQCYQMVHVTAKACKCNWDGNPIRHPDNTILNMCPFDMEFPDGEVTWLTAKEIANAMFAECNVNGNKYLVLECFVAL